MERNIGLLQATLDGSKIVETEDYLDIPTTFIREGIYPYSYGKAYKPAEELKAAAWTLEGAWVVLRQHTNDIFLTDRKFIMGRTLNVKWCDQINGITGTTRLDKKTCPKPILDAIKNGKLPDVSLGFYCEKDAKPGKWKEQPYDCVQRNFMFGHVAAALDEGRCPSPFCGLTVADAMRMMVFDPEETENMIHIRVRDPEQFVEGKFRTIVLSAEQGISAVIGKLKSDPNGSTVVQKYIFDKSKDWTMEKAQAWVKEHKDCFKLETEKKTEDTCLQNLKIPTPETELERAEKLLGPVRRNDVRKKTI